MARNVSNEFAELVLRQAVRRMMWGAFILVMCGLTAGVGALDLWFAGVSLFGELGEMLIILAGLFACFGAGFLAVGAWRYFVTLSASSRGPSP